jgi:hypothetical protein
MKQIYFLLAGMVIAFSSCSVYKNAQTPDDVYYSPGSSTKAAAVHNGQDEYYNTGPSDQYVQMRVQNPARWSYFDDYNYDAYTPLGYGGYGSGFGYGSAFGYGAGLGYGIGYGFGYGMMGGFGYYNPFSFWNSYYAWNNYYNPYYGSVVVYNPKGSSSGVYTKLRPFSAGSYSNSNYYNNWRSPNRRSSSYSPYSQSYRTPSNINNGSGNYRRTYSGSNGSQPTRSYTPSYYNSGSSGGSGSSRSSGSSGGGGGMSRPSRR